MTILNLDKNFSPFGGGIEFEKFDFPSGCEPHIKFSKFITETQGRYQYVPADGERVLITCRIQNANDLILLLLATDALKRMDINNIQCFIPYLPFARQDRVMVEGEPLSVKVIADIINAHGYEKVYIYDAHSDVSLALINNSRGITNHSFVKEVLKDKKDYLIVSPDAGAEKKIYKLCKAIEYKDKVVLCNKIRDVETGEIIETTCDTYDFHGKDLYIVDDIADGGFSFTKLAEVIKNRNCGKINLVVSHGIFTRGLDVFKDIDHIYTTDSFKDHEYHDKLTEIKLLQILLSESLKKYSA